MQQIIARWKSSVKALKRDAYTLYLACRDPRVPWGVRLLAMGVAGYAFSPIDLIPDWIPVLGYLDDLILVPLGILLVVRLMPQPVLAECRERAEALIAAGKPINRVAAVCIIALWVLSAVAMTVWLLHSVR